jgi:hypothetical protein
LVYIFLFLNFFLRHQTMDKVQKYNLFNTNTPSSESYRNYLIKCLTITQKEQKVKLLSQVLFCYKQDLQLIKTNIFTEVWPECSQNLLPCNKIETWYYVPKILLFNWYAQSNCSYEHDEWHSWLHSEQKYNVRSKPPLNSFPMLTP